MKTRTFLFLLMMLFAVACSSENDGTDDGDTPTTQVSSENDSMDHSNTDDGDMPTMQVSVDDLDLSTSKMSDNGTFRVIVEPLTEPIPLNEIHTWKLTVMDADDQPVDDATITFGGGMPEHNHGFPTEPEVVVDDAPGIYLIEGVKMQMSGWWEMKLDIATDTAADSVTFNIVLP